MDILRTAVVGLGEFGSRHLDVLANMPGVEVAALVDIREERARELAERYHVPRIFRDAEELIASVKLDTIHVVTPDTRHFAPAMGALRAGIDIFLEKPISYDLGEARQMIDEAAHLNRKLMIGHILRFDPACAAIKERIASGDMGKIATVYGRRNQVSSMIPLYSHSNRLYTTGIHDIDLILWYFEGRKPVEVYMKTMAVYGQGDDVFWGIITMDDGSLGIVETTWLLPEATPFQRHILLEVIGTKGTALAEVPNQGLKVWTDKVDAADTNYWPSVHGATVGALRDEISYFVQCVRQDRPITIPRPEEAYNGLRIAEALVRSSQQGTPVRL